MFGLLNVNKPTGVTSRDIVNRIQRIVRPIKVGHAGTLDPLATGVLVVCLGPATRLIEFVQRMPKQYRGTFLLGRRSDTEDIEGEVTLFDHPPHPSEQELRSTLHDFLGTIQQVPPAFSALKVAGRRAYDLARSGKTVELAARTIEVHSLELCCYDYPEMVLDIHCGSGTYVRSLGRDVADRLGTAAVMSALQRTAIGRFDIESAINTDDLTAERIRECLIPPSAALENIPTVHLDAAEIESLRYGSRLLDRFGLDGQSEIAAVDANGQLLALLERCPDGRLRPKRNFVGK